MCFVAHELFLIHHEIPQNKFRRRHDNPICGRQNTDEAMKKLKKAVVDFVAQTTELELSINGSKCTILISGK
jgi:hypothetical protein